MFSGLFRKKARPAVHVVKAQLNARLQPMDRSEYFEEGLDDKLRATKTGEIVGGGTMQRETGEIEYCDIEMKLRGDSPADAERMIVATLEALGAPKGSKLEVGDENRVVPFGINEGLAVYLNGTELPAEIYQRCKLEFVHGEFDRLLEGHGQVFSIWRGPTETAFYIYGPSFDEMSKRLEGFLQTYPLCEKSRLERIA